MTDPHYHINIMWSDDDRCWVADVPDLRPCSAHGATPEEALANVRDAVRGWLETAADRGFAIAEPHYRPAIYAARFAA